MASWISAERACTVGSGLEIEDAIISVNGSDGTVNQVIVPALIGRWLTCHLTAMEDISEIAGAVAPGPPQEEPVEPAVRTPRRVNPMTVQARVRQLAAVTPGMSVRPGNRMIAGVLPWQWAYRFDRTIHIPAAGDG